MNQSLLLMVAVVLLAAAVFILDLMVRAGLAVGVLYLLVVLLALKLPRRVFAMLAAAYCSLLIVSAGITKGVFATTPVPSSQLIGNATLELFVLWTTAVFAYGKQGMERTLLLAK